MPNMKMLGLKAKEEFLLHYRFKPSSKIFLLTVPSRHFFVFFYTGPRSAVGNVSGYRCVSDCNSRGREFDPGPIPYFRGN